MAKRDCQIKVTKNVGAQLSVVSVSCSIHFPEPASFLPGLQGTQSIALQLCLAAENTLTVYACTLVCLPGPVTPPHLPWMLSVFCSGLYHSSFLLPHRASLLKVMFVPGQLASCNRSGTGGPESSCGSAGPKKPGVFVETQLFF